MTGPSIHKGDTLNILNFVDSAELQRQAEQSQQAIRALNAAFSDPAAIAELRDAAENMRRLQDAAAAAMRTQEAA